MKIKVGALRALIREVRNASEAEHQAAISAMNPEDVADDDFVDADTGEVYLEKGKTTGTSWMHPHWQTERADGKAKEDAEYEAEKAQWAKEDEEEERLETERGVASLNEFEAAVTEYSESWVGLGHEPEDAAHDAALGFFHQHSSKWREWARDMKMSREEMKILIVDMVADAMRR